ncbi:MAG: hypothetical protein ABI534_06695 [Chloroflexota bacterium]
MIHRCFTACAFVAVALALAACTGSQDEALGGPGLPQQLRGETYPGARHELAGELQLLDNGCVNVVIDGVSRLVIWPAGSDLGDPVTLPDSTPLADGDAITGIGTVMTVNALPGGADGYWGSVTGFCDTQPREVVVFDEVSLDR